MLCYTHICEGDKLLFYYPNKSIKAIASEKFDTSLLAFKLACLPTCFLKIYHCNFIINDQTIYFAAPNYG